jgi:hypothetical protein
MSSIGSRRPEKRGGPWQSHGTPLTQSNTELAGWTKKFPPDLFLKDVGERESTFGEVAVDRYNGQTFKGCGSNTAIL